MNTKETVIETKYYQLKDINKISPYLKDIIDSLKKYSRWKFQLAIANNFISPTNNDEEGIIHSYIDKIDIMIKDEAVEVINKNL